MFQIKLLIGVLLLGGVAYAGWRVYNVYHSTTGTTMERLAATTKGSATLFSQACIAAVAGLGQGVLMLSDYFQMPEVRDFVQENFTAEFAVGATLLFTALTVWARFRTMGQSDDLPEAAE